MAKCSSRCSMSGCWVYSCIVVLVTRQNQIVPRSALRALMLELSNLPARALFGGQVSAPIQKDWHDRTWPCWRHLGGPTEVFMETSRWRLWGVYVGIPLVLCLLSWKLEVFGGREQGGRWIDSHIRHFDLGPVEHTNMSMFFQLSVNNQHLLTHTCVPAC